MPTLVQSANVILPANTKSWPGVDLDAARRVNATERLAAFVAEHACAVIPAEAVLLEDGTYDLHPDIRWCKGDVAPE